MANTPIVLLVHGMGTHPLVNMTKEFKAGLTEAATGFGIEDFDIDEHMEIVEYNYSETLDKIRQTLAANSQAILDQFEALPGAGAAINLVSKLLAFQANLDEDEFIYTHWLDVLLYGGTYYGEPLRIELAKKINTIKKRAAGRDVHIIAHSLGTALVHDTLNKLYRADNGNNGNAPRLIPGIDNIQSLWTFANVSRLVAILNNIDPAETVVQSGPTGCTNYFYTVRNQYDPFTWFKTFDPEIESGRQFVNEVVRVFNTHSFPEYIADPNVARYMLLQIAARQEPTVQENFEAYIAKHKATSINAKIESIQQELDDIRDGDVNSIEELLVAVMAFKEALDSLVDDNEEE